MMAYSSTTVSASRHICEKKDKTAKLDTEELKHYIKRQKELRKLREQQEFKEREKLLENKKQKLQELNKKCKKIVMASEKKHEPRETKSLSRARKEEAVKVATATRSRIAVQNGTDAVSRPGSTVVKTTRSMPTAKTTVSASNVEREAAAFIFKEFENIVRRECKNMLRSKSCQSRSKPSDFDCSRRSTQRLENRETSFLDQCSIFNTETASSQGKHIPRRSRKSMSDAVVPTKFENLTNGFVSEIPRPPQNRASIAFMQTTTRRVNATVPEEKFNEAAAKIQAAYRGYRIRKILSTAKLELEQAILKQQRLRVLTKQTSPAHSPVRRKSKPENQQTVKGNGYTSKEGSPISKIPRSSEIEYMLSGAQFKAASERLPGYIPPPLEPLYRSSSPRVLPLMRPKQIDEPFPKRLESLRSEISQNTPSPLKFISSISKFQMPSHLKSKDPRQSRLPDDFTMNRRNSLAEIDTSHRPSSQAQEYKEKLVHLRSEVGNKYMASPRSKLQVTSRSRRTLSEHMYDIPDPAFAQVLQEKLRLLRCEKASHAPATNNQSSGNAPIGVSQATVSKATEQIKQKIVEAKQILEDYKKELLISSNQILSHQVDEPGDSDFDVQSPQTSLSQSLPTGTDDRHRSAADFTQTKQLKITNISPRKPQVAVRPNTSQSSVECSFSRHERIRTTHTSSGSSRSPKRRTNASSRNSASAVRSEAKTSTSLQEQYHHQSFEHPSVGQKKFDEASAQDIRGVPTSDARDDPAPAPVSSREVLDEGETDYEDVQESYAESRQPENYDTDFDSELQSFAASKQGQRQEVLPSVADTEEQSFKQEAVTSIADTEENSYDDDRSEFIDHLKPDTYPPQAEFEDGSSEAGVGAGNRISEELPPSLEPSAAEIASAKQSVVEELASYGTDFDTEVPSSAPAEEAAPEPELDAEEEKMSSIAIDFEVSARDSTIKEDIPEESSVTRSIFDEVSEAPKPSFKSKIPVVAPPSQSVALPPIASTKSVEPPVSRPSEPERPKVVNEAAKATARRLMDELSESSDSDISTPQDLDDIMEKILAEDSSNESEDEVLESVDTNEKLKVEKPRDVLPEVLDVSPQVDTVQKLEDILSPLPGSLAPPATTTSEATENWSSVVPTERDYEINLADCAAKDAEANVEESGNETALEDSETVTVTKEAQDIISFGSVKASELNQMNEKATALLEEVASSTPKPFVELEPETEPKNVQDTFLESPVSISQAEDSSSAPEIIILAKKIDATIIEKIESMIVEEVSKQITVEEHELEEGSEATKADESKGSLSSAVGDNVPSESEELYESDFDTEGTSEKSEKTSRTHSTSNERSKGKSRLEIVVQEEVESFIETKEIAVEFIVTGTIPAHPGQKKTTIEAKLQDLVRRKELMEPLVVRILQRLLKDVVVNRATAEHDIERIKNELTGSLGLTKIESISPILKPSIEDDLDDSVHGDMEGDEWFEDDLMGTSHTEADEESLKIEAAKILAEQLRIEREIQALEALQAQASPQVPPPPPYSPPASEPAPSPPSPLFTVQCTSEQLQNKINLVVKSVWESWTSTGNFAIAADVSGIVDELQESVCDLEVRDKENAKKTELNPSAISTRAFNTLLHDLIVDTIKEVLLVEHIQSNATKSYVDRIRPGTLALEAAKLRIPSTKEALINLTFCKISNLLPYPMLQNHVPTARKRMTKWTSRSRDLVDEVLAEELIDEDREWTESWPEEILVLDRWTEKFCRRALDQVLSDYQTVFCSPANV